MVLRTLKNAEHETEQANVLGISSSIFGLWYWHIYRMVELAAKEKNTQSSAAGGRHKRLVPQAPQWR